jgi:hypothetical protein
MEQACYFAIQKSRDQCKVKTNLSLYLIKHHATKTYGGVEV